MPSFDTIRRAIESEFPDLGWIVRNINPQEREYRRANPGNGPSGPYFAHVFSEQRDVTGQPIVSFKAEADEPEAALDGCLMQARELREKVRA